MKENNDEFLKPSNSEDWVESLMDFNREDWNTFSWVAHSIKFSKQILTKNENEDYFRDLVIYF